MNNLENYFSLSDEDRKNILQELHYGQNLTIPEIAKLIGTYDNKILRDMKKIGFQKKTKSESMKERLASGKAKHPTKGKPMPKETRARISDKVGKTWDAKTPEEKADHAQKSREAWENRTPEQLEIMRLKAGNALRETAKNGSKLERQIRKELTKAGFVVVYHKEHMLRNEKMHLDILIPYEGIVVEVDGKSHFEPIWGQETFDRSVKADQHKTAMCLAMDYWVIRIKNDRRPTQRFVRAIVEKLLNTVLQIKNGRIKKRKENMVINIEV